MSGYRPEVGDLIGLPRWLPDRPYRVLAVRDPVIPGWLRLDGYLVGCDGWTAPAGYLVPVAALRRLPDPVWDT